MVYNGNIAIAYTGRFVFQLGGKGLKPSVTSSVAHVRTKIPGEEDCGNRPNYGIMSQIFFHKLTV